jgi:hypothetical protein
MFDFTMARTYYDNSLECANESGFFELKGAVLLAIAQLEYHIAQRKPAESNARQALDLFRRLGMRREQAEAEALLARLGD